MLKDQILVVNFPNKQEDYKGIFCLMNNTYLMIRKQYNFIKKTSRDIEQCGSINDIKLDDELLQNIQFLCSLLSNLLKSDLIVEIRGNGLMVDVQIADLINVRTVVEKLLSQGLVTSISGNNTIIVLPPLIVKGDHIHVFFNALKRVWNSF
jgi:acetylornithine/succinyldiaminopimelate/putrescine aminotransferase